MPAIPIVRLGCVTIDPRQAHAYWLWAARNGQLPAACCTPPIDAGGCWADAPTSAYTDPTTDCASWVDINYSESGEFLGVYLTAVQGLDDAVTAREDVQTVTGGSTATAAVMSGRGLRLVGYLAASSCAGMEWGKQWWRRVLDDACRWGGPSTAGCGTGVVSVRAFCPPEGTVDTLTGTRDLVNVSLASAPIFAPVADFAEELACTCTRLEFEVILTAGDPALYRPATSVIARSSFSGALDYAALACDPTPVATVAEPTCLVAPTPPPADVAPAAYDDQGRPSCGPGSAYYDSGAEALVEDEYGHPNYGVGSGYYLRTPGELPVIDWMGRPSCGTGSANFAAVAATSTVTNEQLYTTSTVAQWTERTTSVSDLTWSQADTCTFRFTGTGSVRNVRLVTYAQNRFAAPAQKVVDDRFFGGLQTLTLTVGVSPLASSDQYQWSYAVEVTWEERIDAGQSVTLDWSVGNFASAAGPNAGVDRSCAAQVDGPNAGVDREQRTECVTRIVALPWKVFPTLDPSDTNHPMGGTDTQRAIPLLADEGDRIFGTVNSPGDAKFTVRFNLSDLTAAYETGSVVLWRRLRVRFATPKGPNNAPHPWTIGAVGHGGRFDSLDVYDGTADVLFPMTSVITDEIAVDLAAPIGGTEGWIDYMAMEVECIGGPGYLDCGPNNGVDVDCEPAATTSCYVRPATVALASGRVVPPVVATAAPIIVLEAAVGADLENVSLFGWADPLSRSAPTVDQASFDFWRCVEPCLSGEVPWIPAGGRLTIDCRARTVRLASNGIEVDASRYLTGAGGAPWVWPLLAGPVRIAAVAPSTVDADAKVTVTASIREGV